MGCGVWWRFISKSWLGRWDPRSEALRSTPEHLHVIKPMNGSHDAFYVFWRLWKLAIMLTTMRKGGASVLKRTLASASSPSIQLTTLPNKIRVATENTPGHFSSVGLYVDAGSRYETPHTSGVSHFLDRMAFKVRDISLFPTCKS